MLTWGDAMTDPPTNHRGFPSPIGFPGTLTQHEVGQDDRNLWLRKELGDFWSNFFFPWRFPAWNKENMAPRYFHSFVGIFCFRHLLYLLLLPLVHVRRVCTLPPLWKIMVVQIFSSTPSNDPLFFEKWYQNLFTNSQRPRFQRSIRCFKWITLW